MFKGTQMGHSVRPLSYVNLTDKNKMVTVRKQCILYFSIKLSLHQPSFKSSKSPVRAVRTIEGTTLPLEQPYFVVVVVGVGGVVVVFFFLKKKIVSKRNCTDSIICSIIQSVLSFKEKSPY